MVQATLTHNATSFGQPGYQVPIVVPKKDPVIEPGLVDENAHLKKLNHKLGYLITAYREGSDEYKKEHEFKYKKARKMLFDNNIFLALSAAKKHEGKGVELDQLVQGMKISLYHCTANYNPDKGELSTLAKSYFLLAYMDLLHNETDKVFHLPDYIFQKKDRIEDITRKLTETLTEVPTSEQIAEEYNRLYPHKTGNPVASQHIEGLQDYQKEAKSIEKKKDKQKNRIIRHRHTENETAVAVSDYSHDRFLLSEEINRLELLLLNRLLDDTEILVISTYYGLFKQQPITSFRRIAKIMGYSPQTIKNRHDTALEVLRKALDPLEEAA